MGKLTGLALVTSVVFSTSSCSLDIMRNNRTFFKAVVPGVYYGNYGGPGSDERNTKPADKVDEIYQAHDNDYNIARSADDYHRADNQLLKRLNLIKPTLTDPVALLHVNNATNFFTSGWSKYIGKPKITKTMSGELYGGTNNEY